MSTEQMFIQANINKISKSECKQMLKKAIEMDNTNVIVALTHRVKNIKSLAFAFIKEENTDALRRLMTYYSVKTKVKYAMLDLALENQKMYLTNAVINIVGSKVEYHYFYDYIKYPKVTTPTKLSKNLVKKTTTMISGVFTSSMLPPDDLFAF